MDFRDRSIITQVAFKAAVELNTDVDITDPAGQARFEQSFSYLHQSLLSTIESEASDQAGQLIRGAFPNTTTVSVGGGNGTPWHPSHGQDPNPAPAPYVPQPQFVAQGGPSYEPQQPQPQAQAPQAPQGLRVKGNQFGPLPDWLFEEAAAKGVTEVYDNRDRATGTKRPWFRSTSGGDQAPAFWPPR